MANSPDVKALAKIVNAFKNEIVASDNSTIVESREKITALVHELEQAITRRESSLTTATCALIFVLNMVLEDQIADAEISKSYH